MGCQSSSEKNVRQPVNQVKAGFNGKDFASAVKDRRTIYSINKEIKASDNKIKEIVEYAVKWGPSSFNSQSSRVIVLYGAQHDKFWEATREILRNKVPADKFGPTNDKMTGFKNGYATVMFFEDQETVKKMENQFPSYAHNFQPWSLQSSGMAQYITWAGLETEGFGCSLQHYTPLVDETVQKEWGAPTTWKLLAQMVVGNPTAPAGDKAFMPIQDRVKVFSSQTTSEQTAKQVVTQAAGKGMNFKDFASAVKDRRTIYSLNKEVKVSDARIREVVEYAVNWAPSAFNSQSSRVIVLFGTHHDKFWDTTREILRKIVPAETFAPTDAKMTGFKNGYATVMFFEDQETVKKLETQFPSYAHNFQPWSLQSSGMAQYITWAGLETEGFGCSLQHYTPLVDETVQKEWKAPTTWKLLAQMVVGNPTAPAGDKTFMPIQDRVKVFSSQTTSEQTAKQDVTQAPGKGMNFKDFASAVKDRRTIYSLNKEVKVSDARIREVVEYAVNWAPSSFNSQSSRVIILFGSHHDKFWDTAKEILRKIVPAETFAATESKMTGFKNGYATVMFFEDQEAIKKLEDQFPPYAANFQPWSLQSSGMAQYVAWVGLEAEGLGCSLQHYSPLVDETVQKEWGAPTTWKLLAQMVVGNPTAPAGDKTFLPIENRVKHYK